MKHGDRMEDRHAASGPTDHIEPPRPDDPIFAAFGVDPMAAQVVVPVARSLSGAARGFMRAAVIGGLAAFGLAGGLLLWRESAMTAHAADLKVPAPATAPAATTQGDPFSTAMSKAMMDMHMAMDLPYTGNADRDFARMMIPHHQGAIDMAQLELAYGKDPRLRRLAEEIIVTQQQEIAVMRLVLQDIAVGQAAPGDGPAGTGGPMVQMTGTHAADGMKMDMPATSQDTGNQDTGNQGATVP